MQQKSRQLDQMASIYHWAAVTIVDAAGEDARYGLAGVSIPGKPGTENTS
jgi:hypothetical protein